MPEMIPVGNTIIPPNPQQGLSNLSSLLGVQQQRQQLQTGASLQQTAQAGAQQNQEMMQERQRLQSQIQSGEFGDSNADDFGTKVANWARGNLPLIGNDVAQAAIKTQSDKISLRSSVADLQQKYRAGLGGIVSGFIGANAAPGAVHNAIDEYVRQNPDATEAAHWAGNLLDIADKNPANKDHMLATLASTLSGQPQQGPGSVDVGAKVVPGAVSKFGLGFTPQGAALTKTPGPTETPSYIAQRAYQEAQATGVSGRQNVGNQLANQSPSALDALSRARAILDRGTWTGTEFSLFKDLKNALAGVGIDTQGATDANELVKNLARYEGTRASGVGNTDAARSLFETGSPNTKVDAQAAKNIVTQAMGNEMAIQGYAKSVGAAKTPQEALQKEQSFRSTPNLIEGYEYSLMRSPEEAEQFMKRYGLTRQQLQGIRAQMKQQGLL